MRKGGTYESGCDHACGADCPGEQGIISEVYAEPEPRTGESLSPPGAGDALGGYPGRFAQALFDWRWLEEGGTRLLYWVKRLSRGLANPGGWKEEETLRQHLASMAGLITEETTLVIDTSDIRKDYGHKFQYLDRIRDGERKETAPGYTVPYSTHAPDYDSENSEVLKAVEAVTAAVGTKAEWVADKHFDNRWIFNEFKARRLRFLIAGAHEERTVVASGGGMEPLASVVARVSLRSLMRLKRSYRARGGKPVTLLLHFGAQAVELPETYDSGCKTRHGLKLWLIVVEGFRPEPGGRSFFLRTSL
jgi:hypothetical protein